MLLGVCPKQRSIRGPKRCGAVLVVALLLLSGCTVSGSESVARQANASVPPDRAEPDVPVELYYDRIGDMIDHYVAERNEAFAKGGEAGLDFLVRDNALLLNYTAEECAQAWFDGDLPEDFTEQSTVLRGSIEADGEWRISSGPLAGRNPGRGVFRMVAGFRYEGEGVGPVDVVAIIHLQAHRRTVRHFLMCEDADVMAAVGTGQTAADVTMVDPFTVPPRGTLGDAVTGEQGSMATGTGIMFCEAADDDARAVGDYFLCPGAPTG